MREYTAHCVWRIVMFEITHKLQPAHDYDSIAARSSENDWSKSIALGFFPQLTKTTRLVYIVLSLV